jgi:Fe-S-cluster-containing dehydrogenase component
VTSNAAKTHCLRGHPFDEVNTYWTKRGARDCRACARDRGQRRLSDPRCVELAKARYRELRARDSTVFERANARARERYRTDPEYRELRKARVRASIRKRRDAESAGQAR